MSRTLARLTLDALAELPEEVRECVVWELDPVHRHRAEASGDCAAEKEAWLSAVLLDWGSCGMVLRVDDAAVGVVVYAPATYLPGSATLPTAPPSSDAVLLSTAYVVPELRGHGLGRMLMQAAVKDVLARGGVRAVEAFGDLRPSASSVPCVLPADYLRAVGFKTHRGHARYPRLRMEVSSAVTWRGEVEAALERLLVAVRPRRVPGAATERSGSPGPDRSSAQGGAQLVEP